LRIFPALHDFSPSTRKKIRNKKENAEKEEEEEPSQRAIFSLLMLVEEDNTKNSIFLCADIKHEKDMS
jgi:5-formyltetrahydrofolate cyclo-ligase